MERRLLEHGAVLHAHVIDGLHADDVGARLDARHESLRDRRAAHYLDPAVVLVLGAQDCRAGEQARVHELQQLAHVLGRHLVQEGVVDDDEMGLLELVDELLVAAVEGGAGDHELIYERVSLARLLSTHWYVGCRHFGTSRC